MNHLEMEITKTSKKSMYSSTFCQLQEVTSNLIWKIVLLWWKKKQYYYFLQICPSLPWAMLIELKLQVRPAVAIHFIPENINNLIIKFMQSGAASGSSSRYSVMSKGYHKLSSNIVCNSIILQWKTIMEN